MSTRVARKTPGLLTFIFIISIGWLRPAATADSANTPASNAGVTTAGTAVNPTATPRWPSKTQKIEKEELLGHIKHLSSTEFNGREAGTADQLKAAAYVADEFKRYGLEPFGDEKEGKNTYFQTFPMKIAKGIGKETALKAKFGEKQKSFDLKKEFAPFPATLEKTKADAGVAFAGYGIVAPELNYDDFANVDLAGKWALILRYEPQEKDANSKFDGKEHSKYAALHSKIMNCAMRRAAGVMIVVGPAGRENEPEKLTDGSGALIGEFSIPVLQINRSTADEILSSSKKSVAELQKAIDKDLSNHSFVVEDVTLSGVVELEYNDRNTANVIARLIGSDEKLRDEYVVVGAHCDHIGKGSEGSLLGKEGNGKLHPGADDNASGTAGLLEIAQHYAALKPEDRPRRSILFMAFSGEEKGLLGSKHYLTKPKVPVKDTVAMLNMDMIGRSAGGDVQVSGVGTSKGFKELVQKCALDQNVKVHMGSGGSGPSDHASFNEKKIPVLFFFTGIHPDYHRPSDTWEKINAPASEAIATLASKALKEIANNPARPEYTQAGPGGYLGVGPDQKRKDEKGFPVGQVLPGSPAEQAGIKAGDLIRIINGQELNSAMDLHMSLIDMLPGDSLDMVVHRGEKKIEMTVKLGKRKTEK